MSLCLLKAQGLVPDLQEWKPCCCCPFKGQHVVKCFSVQHSFLLNFIYSFIFDYYLQCPTAWTSHAIFLWLVLEAWNKWFLPKELHGCSWMVPPLTILCKLFDYKSVVHEIVQQWPCHVVRSRSEVIVTVLLASLLPARRKVLGLRWLQQSRA